MGQDAVLLFGCFASMVKRNVLLRLRLSQHVCKFFADICLTGVVKTYKLTYEAVEVQHAIFDPKKVENRWCLDAHVLREVIEHFGSNAEQLDIYCKNDRAVFTSFTTKVIDGNGAFSSLQTPYDIPTDEKEMKQRYYANQSIHQSPLTHMTSTIYPSNQTSTQP